MRNGIASLLLALLVVSCVSMPPPQSALKAKRLLPPQYITVMMQVKFIRGFVVVEQVRSMTSKAKCAWAIVAATEFNQSRAADDNQKIVVGCYWPKSNKKV